MARFRFSILSLAFSCLRPTTLVTDAQKVPEALVRTLLLDGTGG
jgi:hypothetical protein